MMDDFLRSRSASEMKDASGSMTLLGRSPSFVHYRKGKNPNNFKIIVNFMAFTIFESQKYRIYCILLVKDKILIEI
ncbi:hypothetical protein [Roseinatronobacter monicus]|uniref:Uncharacterized protein n=1 Tax=Roseinatronobacter monicus TaxID=393481 RepID=A0A543K5Z3_9RHOB|nr:hypothetical protein [Roseinatronobacter monicus]TQM90500.1 hypothetical protein BD293_3891 [Roseinatronobacter monicus]